MPLSESGARTNSRHHRRSLANWSFLEKRKPQGDVAAIFKYQRATKQKTRWNFPSWFQKARKKGFKLGVFGWEVFPNTKHSLLGLRAGGV